MINEDLNLITNFFNERNVKQRTRYGYNDSFNKFINFIDDSLTHRLKVYVEEEENTPWRRRTMKKDLVGFQNHLLSNLLFNTAKVHFTRILTFLRHHDFEIHHLPKMNQKNANLPNPIYHTDLLSKDEIKQAITYCKNRGVSALIVFCCSSGCGRSEALNLTVRDFLLANNTFFNNTDDVDEIKGFVREVDCSSVPMFHLKRQKTNKYYYTFCTPQANHMIKFHILTRKYEKSLSLDSPLFKINLDYLNRLLGRLNDDLGFGKAGVYNRLRMHMFRKYHASTLYNAGMKIQDVDSLQGRGKDRTHSAYFMEDPLKLKEKYMQYLDVLTI